MSTRPTVLLLIPHLGGGGAERVTEHLTGGLDPARFDLHLGLVTQQNTAAHVLPPWVTVHCMGARRVRSGAWSLLCLVRCLRPDVIVSGMAHLNLLALLLRPLFPRHTRLIIRQNGALLANGTSGLYRTFYPRADAVVCQTPAMAVELTRATGPNGNMRVLRNPVDMERIRAVAGTLPSLWSGPGPHLLAVGRLAPEKGFDLLLTSLAALRSRFPSADLTILGEGRERPALEVLARVLGLRTALRLAGYVDQPAAWFPGATLFVLTSRHEGLPNALLEAAAAGLPVVTTSASQGLVDLVGEQPGVWVAPEISVQGITTALQDALDWLQPGRRFVHPWIEDFRKDRAIAAYEALIEEQLTGAAS
jgi:glycosyltransferase involved in cell wall biosynthesis